MPAQLALDFGPDPNCPHKHTFWSHAKVPGGDVCTQCGIWINRGVVYQDEPARIGYVSADWAWHYRDGLPWTS